MTQPNFLQVQTSLDRACAFVETHPDLQSSERYGARLSEMRARFAKATRDTDGRYTEWRKAVGNELGEYQLIKQEYDRVLEMADEHGYDDAPQRRIVYSEADQLFALVEETVAWLRGLGDEWAWTGEAAEKLTRLVEESRGRAAAQKALYQQYTVEVKRRVSAYDDAVSLIREYLADARRDGGRFEDYAALRLDQI